MSIILHINNIICVTRKKRNANKDYAILNNIKRLLIKESKNNY